MYPRQDYQSGLYGYWDRKTWAIQPEYKYAHRFVEKYAAVDMVDGRSCLIGIDGRHFPLDAICNGRTPIQDDAHSFSGFSGYESQSPRYAVVWTESDGHREWGLIDSRLNYAPLPDDVFTSATTVRPCGKHVVLFHAKGRGTKSVWGLFNLDDMRLEIPEKYSHIYTSNENIWVVSRASGENQEIIDFAFYDISKRDFLPGWFPFALPFSCGLGAVRVGEWNSDGRSYFVDTDLRPAFNAEFDEVGPFSYGLAAVYNGDDAGYIDTTGQMRLLLPYEDLQPFNEFGLAIANRDKEQWDIDIIDREGRSKISGLETAVFWEGDFPYYQITKDGDEHIYDIYCNIVY
jgi:hypothetical protein